MEPTPNKQSKIDEIALKLANYLNEHNYNKWNDTFIGWVEKIKEMGDVSAQIFDRLFELLAENGNAKQLLNFAKNIDATQKTNAKRYFDALFEIGDINYLTEFLHCLTGSEYDDCAPGIALSMKDIKPEHAYEMIEKVIKTGNAECMGNLLLNISHMDFSEEEKKNIRANLVNEIIKTGDVKSMCNLAYYDLCKDFEISADENRDIRHTLADAIIESHDAESVAMVYNYNPDKACAKLVKIGNVHYIVDRLITYYHKNNYYYMDENQKKLETALFNSKNAELIYDTAWHAFYGYSNKEPLPRFEDAITKTRNAEYIYRYACTLPVSDVSKFVIAIVEIGDDFYIRKMFVEYTTYRRDYKIDTIIKTNNVQYMLRVIRYDSYFNEPRLTDKIIELGTDLQIIAAALECRYKENSNKLLNYIIKNGKIEAIISLAKHYQTDFYNDRQKRLFLEDAILASKDALAIRKFADEVYGANKQKLIKEAERLENNTLTPEDELNNLISDLETKKA